MSTWRVKYLDNQTGEHTREWEGEAKDSAEAIDLAFDADYYLGNILEVEEV